MHCLTTIEVNHRITFDFAEIFKIPFPHQYRLSAYFKLDISSEIKEMLKDIIGKKLGKQLVDNIANGNFDISNSFIKKCKWKMLFINGNFVKMLQSRIL